MPEITTSLVIAFNDPNTSDAAGAGVDATLRAEVDGREDGLNGGRTSFRPGDPVHYLVYASDNVTIVEHFPTTGAIAAAGGGVRTVERTLTWVNVKEQTLPYPIVGAFGFAWIGRDGGPVTVASQTRLIVPNPAVGVLRVTYSTRFEAFRLSNVPAAHDSALVFLRGEHG